MKEIDYKEVGERIRIKRKETGLTQKDAANKVNLSKDYWYKMEKGRVNTISLGTLFSISNMFETDIGYFLADSTDYNKDVIYREIESMLDSMTKNQRIISMDLLKVVYNNPEMFEPVEIDEYEEDDDEK